MSKKIYITESQFNRYLTEELSVAKETIEMSNSIISSIYEHLDKDENYFVFDTPYNTVTDVVIYLFNNNKELSDWLDNGGDSKLFNGFSFKENTFYIRGVKVGDEVDMTVIENNVYHEVEHFIQSLKKGKPLTGKKYDIISKYINSNDTVVSFVCQLLYSTTKFELDACANGFYSDLRHFDLGRIKLVDIIKNTECGILLDRFSDWRTSLNNWSKTTLINAGRIKLFNLGIVKYTNLNELKTFLTKRIDKARTYLLKRIGKIYALSKKEYDESIISETNTNPNACCLFKHDGLHRRIKMDDAESCSDLKQYFKEYE